MKYYIIIRGPAGAGKTTIAGKLAGKIKGRHVCFDKIMRKNGLDKIEGKGIKQANFIKVNELVIPGALKMLKKNRVVVFDGCFYHRPQLRHLIKNLPYRHFVFTLRASLEDCIKRDGKRKGSSKIGKRNVEAVHELCSKFDYGTVVNTEGKTAEQTTAEITSRLPKN